MLAWRVQGEAAWTPRTARQAAAPGGAAAASGAAAEPANGAAQTPPSKQPVDKLALLKAARTPLPKEGSSAPTAAAATAARGPAEGKAGAAVTAPAVARRAHKTAAARGAGSGPGAFFWLALLAALLAVGTEVVPAWRAAGLSAKLYSQIHAVSPVVAEVGAAALQSAHSAAAALAAAVGPHTLALRAAAAPAVAAANRGVVEAGDAVVEAWGSLRTLTLDAAEAAQEVLANLVRAGGQSGGVVGWVSQVVRVVVWMWSGGSPSPAW